MNDYDANGKKIGHSSPSFFGGMNHYDNNGHKVGAVSYTHLDVYKRQAMQDMLLYIWGMDRLYMPARKEPALHMVMRPIVLFYQSDAYRRVKNGIRKTRESESLLHNRGK